MNRYVACLIVAVFTLTALPPGVTSASSDPTGDVEVLVDGAPQRRYAHDGRWYIEAVKGREYAIRLRNPYPVRVAVALSVDGLNTIDARQTTAAEARKWVLDPYETVTIRGWQTSSTEARRFTFTTEARSYGQALGKTANLGVIAAVFFKERSPAILSDTTSDSPRRLEAAPTSPAQAQTEAPAAAAASPSPQGLPSPAATGNKKADGEYAATGMGGRTGHVVTQVRLELEEAAAHTVNIRYEFRAQLVRLGILPPTADALQRRERAQGFEPGFCPEPR